MRLLSCCNLGQGYYEVLSVATQTYICLNLRELTSRHRTSSMYVETTTHSSHISTLATTLLSSNTATTHTTHQSRCITISCPPSHTELDTGGGCGTDGWFHCLLFCPATRSRCIWCCGMARHQLSTCVLCHPKPAWWAVSQVLLFDTGQPDRGVDKCHR